MQGAYWFPAKTHGWGWGLPVAWQGWVVMAVYAAVLLAAVLLLQRKGKTAAFAAAVVAATAALVGICLLAGEPPGGWRP